MMAAMSDIKIRRALIAVYDKTGIADFARTLVEEFGIEIISTGGTARHLKEAGVPVTMVEEVTGFPELLDGRVKTLHPKIHAGILADRDNPEHMRQLEEHGIRPIDMVVVNLYPFEKTVADPNCKFDDAIEMIDIGGPCMLRAAAKNHKHVLVLSNPNDYAGTLAALRAGDGMGEYVDRAFNAVAVFQTTSQYDFLVENYLFGRTGGAIRGALDGMAWDSVQSLLSGQEMPSIEELVADESSMQRFIDGFSSRMEAALAGQPSEPGRLARGALRLSHLADATYGENPSQRATVWCVDWEAGLSSVDSRAGKTDEATLTSAKVLSEAKPSFNNYVDGDAALGLVKELSRESLAGRLVWHRRPAGVSGCGTGVSPAQKAAKQPPWKPVDDETITRRNLPHIQKPGRTYFVTFRVRSGELPPEARDITLNACHYWHGRKMNLHIAIVMPDHVHLLLTPYLHPNGDAVPLGEILHSIKSYSSHEIRKRLGGSGPVWLDENWDRVMRHEKEFYETWEYIDTNPERAKLPTDYAWKWWSDTRFQEGGEVQGRKDVAALQQRTGETPVPHIHRRDAGATPLADHQGTSATPSEARGSLCAVAFIKHTNACGCAIGDDPVDTYRRAYLGDPIAAAGGVLCMNFPVTREIADAVMNSFGRWGKAAGAAFFKLDVWIAPAFDDDALELITTPTEKRKWGAQCRLLAVGGMDAPPDPDELDYKKIAGGMLVQTRDLLGLNEEDWKVVTKRAPDEREMADLRFAWLVCKHTKSNAITLCRDGALLGNGAGQMSRVKSCDLAIQLSRENGHGDRLAGAVAAGDAFFPVPDGPQKLIDAGITAIIHPGGSNRDADTIAACDAAGVAMILTGTRHFKH